MKCPIDDTLLQMTDRQGIEIDYCPQCRGVWLDRGELDKVIDRSMTVSPSAPPPAPPPAPATQPPAPAAAPPSPGPSYDSRRPSYPQQGYDDRRSDSGHYKKKKKESFLGELFDF